MSAWSAWSKDMVKDSSISFKGVVYEYVEEAGITQKDIIDIHEKLAFFENLIFEKFEKYISVSKVKFKLTGSTAGMAYPREKMININTAIFNENREDYLHHRTLGHEYAHIVNYQIMDGKGHDNNWKFIMRVLGLEPSRCHDYEVSHLKRTYRKPYVYRCNCSEFHLSTRIHNSIVRGVWRRCKKCGEILKFQYKEI